jgi:hypothetical protein
MRCNPERGEFAINWAASEQGCAYFESHFSNFLRASGVHRGKRFASFEMDSNCAQPLLQARENARES